MYVCVYVHQNLTLSPLSPCSITALDDPCPMPGKGAGGHGASGDSATERKTLKTKDNLLYAPMANVGRLSMDRSGMYIDIKNIYFTDKEHLELREGAYRIV